MDHEGRVTSHLSGIIYRTSNFVAAGIKPAFVFDGEPPRLKARTIVARGEIKRRAEREWRGGGGGRGGPAARPAAKQKTPPPGGEGGKTKRRPHPARRPCVRTPPAREGGGSARGP